MLLKLWKLSIIGTFLFLFIVSSQLPDIIPTSWVNGEVTAWSQSRSFVITLLIIQTFWTLILGIDYYRISHSKKLTFWAKSYQKKRWKKSPAHFELGLKRSALLVKTIGIFLNCVNLAVMQFVAQSTIEGWVHISIEGFFPMAFGLSVLFIVMSIMFLHAPKVMPDLETEDET